MPASRRAFAILGLVFAISAALVAGGDKKSKPKPKSRPAAAATPAPMDDDKRLVHALNRFTFGVRPGDVERVRAMGLDKWFEQQLHPEKIDDSALEARLAPFRTLKMSTREMVENFPPPQILKAVENGRMSMPSDPAKRAIYQSRMVAMDENQQKKQDAAAATAANNNAAAATNTANADKDASSEASMKGDARPEAPSDPAAMTAEKQRQFKQREDAMYADLQSDTLLSMPAEQRYKSILSMSPQERLDLAREYRGPRALQLVDGMKPEQAETIQAITNPQIVVGGELSSAKLLRAIYSDRQLEEVMTDFWFNHFNVFIGKGPDRYMITAYERDAIRPHVLGKFKDLLSATAHSPAMLFYLDNWESVGPNSELAVYGPQGPRRMYRRDPFGGVRRVPPRPQNNKNRPSGLNENYAREIMELHTLGVDGGYTQKDVTELAKVLTGWSIDEPQRGGSFRFKERAHEPGPKFIFGQRIQGNGEKEGEEMLDLLAHHPSTAKFISRKLAMRFVSDNPPPALVDRMAAAYLKKDGEIREVLRTMFNSPEFWAADAYRAKVKTPLEFVASSVRASGLDVQNALPLVQNLNRMGMPLYGMQPPTGYSMKAETWVNSSALLTRMNFALALGAGKLPGTTLDPQNLLHGQAPADAQSALAVLESGILAGDVSAQTHAVLEKRLNDPQVTQRKLDDSGRPPNYGVIAGLIMGSPEFQRR
ncbi:MAG TPA: DUF1800 domain-containing protein [Candidatus Angelobacter sp.]|nr:DUF1800 domain-containing protein [Candidatus Angelobacter sp.]